MTFAFVIEVGEIIHNTFPFQSMFLQFPWHKWLLLSFWKERKIFITPCCFNPCFCYFLDINDFSFRSGKRGSYSSHFSISINVSAIFLTKVTFFFVIEAGEVIHNTFLFQFMFLQFPWHQWLLFSFWRQEKLFITLSYFNPCFYNLIDINDFCCRSGSKGIFS